MSNGVTQPFRVGGVISRGFGILFRNFVTFGLVTVFVLLPYAVIWLVIGEPFTTNFSSLRVVLTIALLVITPILLAYVAIAANSHGAFEALRGQRPGIARCILRGLSLFMPVLGVAILTMLALAASMAPAVLATIYLTGWPRVLVFVLMLAPLFAVYTVLWVAIPAVVIERLGALRGLSRSIALTEGIRWRVFGTIAILWLINWLANLLVGLLMVPVVLATGIGSLSLIATIVLALINLALNAVMSTVAYHDLRVAREGFSIDDVASVFD